ncbi:hypothetical protein ADK55_01890 [Streptomyces sp. WM4235]|nr:hypothetical protein ADK55_01890 [Streptomyces sp. WM4235]
MLDAAALRDRPDKSSHTDFIIRTSGEQRLPGFLLWQSAHAEIHWAEYYWPAFRRADFLRALRSYGGRERRFGKQPYGNYGNGPSRRACSRRARQVPRYGRPRS